MPRRLIRLQSWFGAEWSEVGTGNGAGRLYILVGSLVAIPIYTAFASVNYFAYGAVKMAVVTTIAALVALFALCLLRLTDKISQPGHCFTLALAIQVFGEMSLNGGLQAPAAALSLLVVPAATITTGASAAVIWAVITVTALSTISVMDINGMLPANELPVSAQQFDRMFSMSAGIVFTAMLVYLFQRQTNMAFEKLREERANFRHSALHDALTDMPNRRQFSEYVNASLGTASAERQELALFYFDIDRFKQINDQHGHAAGDQLLQAFAERLQSRVVGNDLAARLAGDEFAMISECNSDTLSDTMDWLRAITDEPFALGEKRFDVQMSIGYALFPSDGRDLDALLRVADERMYENKSSQTNTSNPIDVSNVIELPTVPLVREDRRAGLG